jgi:WD40 repeat protein
VAFSPDGKRLATGSFGGTAKLWDTATGQEMGALKGHSDGVHSVAFSPDGKRLATGSFDRTVRLWDAATEQEVLSRSKL